MFDKKKKKTKSHIYKLTKPGMKQENHERTQGLFFVFLLLGIKLYKYLLSSPWTEMQSDMIVNSKDKDYLSHRKE